MLIDMLLKLKESEETKRKDSKQSEAVFLFILSKGIAIYPTAP
jgi:hypothetical protein